jgi:hypothetical protein
MAYGSPAAPSPAPPTSGQNITGACGNISGCSPLSGSKNLSLAPGSYGTLSVSGDTTVHLQAGTYNINSLSLSGKSDLVVDSTPVLLNFAGQGLSGNDTALDLTGGTITNAAGKPSGLEIIYGGTAAVKVSGGPDSYGLVYAPNANVVLDGGADWYGAIIASTVTGVGNSAIHYDRALENSALSITANLIP